MRIIIKKNEREREQFGALQFLKCIIISNKFIKYIKAKRRRRERPPRPKQHF